MGSKVLSSVKLSRAPFVEGADAPSIQDQLRDALTKNAVRVIDLFKEWDANGDGTVSRREFRAGVSQMGFDAPRADVHALVDTAVFVVAQLALAKRVPLALGRSTLLGGAAQLFRSKWRYWGPP